MGLEAIETTPWYDSLILYRQDEIDNWDNVINQIKLGLKKLQLNFL